MLAEFAAIRDELNKLLLNLEGSTFVKRLKAASRKQFDVADQVERFTLDAFGGDAFGEPDDGDGDEETQRGTTDNTAGKSIVLGRLSGVETEESGKLRNIAYDLRAFYERRPMANTKKVLDAMEEEPPVPGLTSLARRLVSGRPGESLARAEYWGDTFDQWAEMLVDIASGGT